jgi:hypothetical protein
MVGIEEKARQETSMEIEAIYSSGTSVAIHRTTWHYIPWDGMLHLQGGRVCWGCLRRAWLSLVPWRWRQYVPRKFRRTSAGQHGVTSQKIVLLIGGVTFIFLRSRCTWRSVRRGVVLTNLCYCEDIALLYINDAYILVESSWSCGGQSESWQVRRWPSLRTRSELCP